MAAGTTADTAFGALAGEFLIKTALGVPWSSRLARRSGSSGTEHGVGRFRLSSFSTATPRPGVDASICRRATASAFAEDRLEAERASGPGVAAPHHDQHRAARREGRRTWLPLSDTASESAVGAVAALLLAGFGRLASSRRIELRRGALAVALRASRATRVHELHRQDARRNRKRRSVDGRGGGRLIARSRRR